MYIEKNDYNEAKRIFEVILSKDLKDNIITKELLGHLDYDLVECSDDEEDRIISNILYQNMVVKYTGKPYDLPSLLKDIETIEQGFKFERIQLNDEEYADLKSIVNQLKEFIKENDSESN